ncbi:hypothetical protein ACFQS6_08910 [Xanthomonas populi]
MGIASLPAGLTRKVLQLTYAYQDLKPVVGAPYLVLFDDGTQHEGMLDDKGQARIENPPGPSKVFFGYDQRAAFAYPKRPKNPPSSVSSPPPPKMPSRRWSVTPTPRPSTWKTPISRTKSPPSIAAATTYDDLADDYAYFDEFAPAAHDHHDTPGTHEEILLTGNEGQPATPA